MDAQPIDLPAPPPTTGRDVELIAVVIDAATHGQNLAHVVYQHERSSGDLVPLESRNSSGEFPLCDSLHARVDRGDGIRHALDVVEEDKSYTVTTSLPGVKAEDIKVNMHDDLLTIEAEIPAKTTEKTETTNGRKVLMQERAWGKFSRSIRLPQTVKSDSVEAAFDNGVLTLTLPKADNVLPRSIPVKALKSKS